MHLYPRDSDESRGCLLFVVPYPDEVSGLSVRFPRDVEPVGTGQELVGIFACLQEVDQLLELCRVLGADVGSLTEHVLRVWDAAHEAVDARVAVTGIDDDRAADGLSGKLQQMAAAVGEVVDDLWRGNVVGILAEVEEFRQQKVFREFDVFH